MIFISHTAKDKTIVEPIALRLAQVYGQNNRVCEEKSVIKIFYDNDWGWKLVPELASLVLYITGLSGHVKSRRKFPPVLLEIYGLFW